MGMYCTNCGEGITGNNRYCTGCGAGLPQQSVFGYAQYRRTAGEDAQRKRKTYLTIIVVSAAAVVLSIIFAVIGVAVITYKSPEQQSAQRDYEYNWNQDYNSWLGRGYSPSDAETMANYVYPPPKTTDPPAAGFALVFAAMPLFMFGIVVFPAALVKYSRMPRLAVGTKLDAKPPPGWE